MRYERRTNSIDYRQADSGTETLFEKGCARVAAVIVLYYPQSFLLARLVDGLLPQTDKLFIIDNTPSCDEAISDLLAHKSLKLTYHANGYNAGLASAQNWGIRAAVGEGFTHVLLVDQDSALPKEGVHNLLAAERRLIEAGCDVSAVGPLFVDEKTGQRSHAVRRSGFRVKSEEIPAEEKNPIETDYLIASGSLIRTGVLKKVGYMRDELFIDWVDTEWAYRAKEFGLAAYVIPTVIMKHSVGDKTGEFLGRRVNLHSSARNYYIVRNAMYLLQERHMSWRWRFTMVMYVPKYILVHSWLSRNRSGSFVQMLLGVRDGIMRKMKPYSSL